ncbi:MAG: NirD/YgiW/YdeI family stress tolerance protein [Alphaproteobacteria bacterium]
MKKYAKIFLTVAGIAALLPGLAHADVDAVKKQESGTAITIEGNVEKVSGERKFVLRDKSGLIDVEIENNQSSVMKQGDSVTVTGMVHKGMLGTTIQASRVDVKQGMAQGLSDAIDSATDGATTKAQTVTVQTLPRTGMVRLLGTVDSVGNEKNFTLKDQTGRVNVKITSEEAAVLTQGAEVTVIGYVDTGLFSKNINATHVITRADAALSAGAR